MNDTETLLQEVLTETKKKTNWSPLYRIMGLFIVLWLLNGVILNRMPLEYRGIIGDMFGASNALFSGLALAAVAYSLWMQRSELELTRKITLISAMELRKSVEAQEEQANSLNEQKEATVAQNNLMSRQLKLQEVASKISIKSNLLQLYSEDYKLIMRHNDRRKEFIDDWSILKKLGGDPFSKSVEHKRNRISNTIKSMDEIYTFLEE